MSLLYNLLLVTGCLAVTSSGWAQAPVLQQVLPRANATAAPRTGPVQLSFSQPMSAQSASADAVRVVSRWRGPLPGTFQGGGSLILTFSPAAPFMAGEPLQISVGPPASSTSGMPLAKAAVYDITTETSPSNGLFLDEDVAVELAPRCMALGDINHDGNLDFIVGGSSTKLTIRFGNGQGGFAAPPAPIPGGIPNYVDSPAALKLVDVNKDGHLDLLVLDGGSLSVPVLMGDGTGRFTFYSYTTITSDMRGLGVADFNADGNLDLAVGMSRKSAVAIRYGNGKGGFTVQPDVPSDSSPTDVAVEDVNHDGRPDLLILNNTSAGGSLSTRLNTGAGTFTAMPFTPIATGAAALTLGDINMDGHVDVLAVCSSTNAVSVRLGDGKGGFKAPANAEVAVGLAPRGIAVADINRDGHLDFVTGNADASSTTVSFRLGDGTGGFTKGPVAEYVTGLGPFAVALVDVNQDGQPDLLAGNTASSRTGTTLTTFSVSVRVGDGAGRFNAPAAARVFLAKDAAKLALGDLNHDGRLDMLSIERDGTASVRLGVGQGRFVAPPAPTAAEVLDIGPNFGVLALGDVNDDGHLDFVTIVKPNYYTAQVAVYVGNGKGGFSRQSATGPAVETTFDVADLVLTDLTGDGNLDLLACSHSKNKVSVRIGNGRGGFTLPAAPVLPEVEVGTMPTSLAAGDFNGDGNMDFATANLAIQPKGAVSIRLGDGAGGFTSPAVADIYLGLNQPSDIALGDVNNDGNLDFVTCSIRGNSQAGDNILVRLGDGKGGFIAPAIPEVRTGTNPSGIALGDLNGDGNLDVVTAGNSSGQISVRFGDGAGGLVAPTVGAEVGVGPRPDDVLLGDLDQDGDLDAMVPNHSEPSVSIRLNGPFTGTVLPVKQNLLFGSVAPKLGVYPNPAATGDRVQVTGALTAVVQLLDLTGRILRTQSSKQPLQVRGLAPGMYFVRAGNHTTRLEVR